MVSSVNVLERAGIFRSVTVAVKYFQLTHNLLND